MAKRQTYSREEAIAWMAQGYRARPRYWARGTWLALSKDGCGYVGSDGGVFSLEYPNSDAFNSTWLLIGKARMGREARIAELEAETEKLVEQRNDAMRKHDALADQLREATGKLTKETERGELWYRCFLDEQAECGALRKELEAAKFAAPRFKVGDVVQRNPNGERMIVDRVNLVSVERGAGMRFTYPQDELQPATDPQPEPEWHPCSAEEARKRHLTGKRVRSLNWFFAWIVDGITHECGDPVAALSHLLTAKDDDGWQWAEPLPEGGVS